MYTLYTFSFCVYTIIHTIIQSKYSIFQIRHKYSIEFAHPGKRRPLPTPRNWKMAEEDADIVIGTDMPNQSGVFGIMPVRNTGLQQQQQPLSRHRDSHKRKASHCIVREDPAWQCVQILASVQKFPFLKGNVYFVDKLSEST